MEDKETCNHFGENKWRQFVFKEDDEDITREIIKLFEYNLFSTQVMRVDSN